MEIVHFIYEGNPENPVDFEPTGKDNVMVNATQMAHIFGKRLDVFLKTDHASEFIKVLEFTPFGGNSEPLKRDEIIQSRGQSGTWMHRILALKFAAWLDVAFEIWVYSTIDQMLNHFYREQRDTRLEKIFTKERKAALRIELIKKHPEIAEYFRLEDKEREASNKLIKLIKEQEDQLRIEFRDFEAPSQS